MNSIEIAKQIESGKCKEIIKRHFSTEFSLFMSQLNQEGVEKQLNDVIREPINLSGEMSREILEFYYIVSWFNLFGNFNIPRNLNVFEIGSGEIDYIPKAVDSYSSGQGGNYVTANLNKGLTEGFREKTKNLDLNIEIVQDHGGNILNYYNDETMDVIAFHHAINDIIQTIIADIEGIDTIQNDWWDIEPQMLQTVMEYHNKGKLKTVAFGPFIDIIKTGKKILKSGGYMIFDNCTYDGYESIGYSSKFHSDYINLIREWIKEADLGLEEVELPSYDKKWWMILKKI